MSQSLQQHATLSHQSVQQQQQQQQQQHKQPVITIKGAFHTHD